ncbi:MAG: two-component system, chemotaxis family, sensor kinase CheA [Campylobacterota bacterium]|nr:two-component system, chemotaxis family, sensor kinase CheA [Campylobacterota bacterium]
MISQEELRGIFIEEANEIIEKLDVDIIKFEQNADDFSLLNEIFRGVHTLKGNSNAFGFTRLGKFVHHFEDLLSYCRSEKEIIEKHNLELFVNSVDAIKEIMACELTGMVELPSFYDELLGDIKKLLNEKTNPSLSQSKYIEQEGLSDLASEFGDIKEDFDITVQKILQEYQEQCSEELNLYRVELKMDCDYHKRGFDYLVFLKNLNEDATAMESFFDLRSEDCIKKVVSVLLSKKKIEEIKELFEFLFDHEYEVTQLKKVEPKIEEKIEEKKEDKAAPTKTASITNGETTQNHQKSTIRIDTVKLDELFDSVGELVITQNFIAQNEKIYAIEDESINRTIETLSKITKKIQDRVMSLRMVAIKDTFEKMKRVVRDTSKKTNKELELIVQGEDTEIDKTMIESLSDPLIHIIRNAIDHGLEDSVEDRIKTGKNPQGTLTLKAFHKSGNIVISVSDDGRGINKEKVLKKAIERGVATENENLTDSQIFALIMQPGFSTADAVSDLSGRGVGLDVVKTSIEKLRGKIEIDSKENEGTTFSMILPLTLAIIDGMLVRVADEIYIIPTLSVVESFCPSKEIVHFFKEKGEFVSLREEHIPIIRLNDIFQLTEQKKHSWESILVCLETEGGKIALMVDELIGRQQVVIKPLGKSLSKIKEISGGAILGNGDIALILNVDTLIAGNFNG